MARDPSDRTDGVFSAGSGDRLLLCVPHTRTHVPVCDELAADHCRIGTRIDAPQSDGFELHTREHLGLRIDGTTGFEEAAEPLITARKTHILYIDCHQDPRWVFAGSADDLG